MKKAFTIVELLVASLLLGMLVTVLTMIFNQSSIAWRTGDAIVADLDKARQNDAEIRDEADNAYVWNGKVYRLLSPWDEDGNMRKRAWNADGSGYGEADTADYIQKFVPKSGQGSIEPKEIKPADLGSVRSSSSAQSYTVNVMSAGPNRKFGDYDDIWSVPDDFD